MDLCIDGAGQDHRRAENVARARGGGRAFADQGHAAIAYGDETALDLAVRQDHTAR